MTTEMNASIADKPSCYAIPHEFHVVRPKCENCITKDLCGSFLVQALAAIKDGSFESAQILKKRVRDFETRVDYWRDGMKVVVSKLSPSLFNSLILRAVDAEQRKEVEDEALRHKASNTIRINAERAMALAEDKILIDTVTKVQSSAVNENSNLASTVAVKKGMPKALPVAMAVVANVPKRIAAEPVLPPLVATVVVVEAPVMVCAAKIPVAVGAPESSVAYCFLPPSELSYWSYSNAEYVAKLKQLLSLAFHETPAIGYSAIREEYCAINIEMNLRQRHAPQFRPMEKLNKIPANDDEILMARDRQVIDIHWRAYSADKPFTASYKYPTIFDNAPFKFAIAERLAIVNLSPQNKVIDLGLSSSMQLEHAILKESKFRDQWRTICFGDQKGDHVRQKGAIHIERIIRDAIDDSATPINVNHIPGMMIAWKARELVGKSPNKIVNMITLMTGENGRDASAVTKTLKSVDNYLTNSGKLIKKTTELGGNG